MQQGGQQDNVGVSALVLAALAVPEELDALAMIRHCLWAAPKTGPSSWVRQLQDSEKSKKSSAVVCPEQPLCWLWEWMS